MLCLSDTTPSFSVLLFSQWSFSLKSAPTWHPPPSRQAEDNKTRCFSRDRWRSTFFALSSSADSAKCLWNIISLITCRYIHTYIQKNRSWEKSSSCSSSHFLATQPTRTSFLTLIAVLTQEFSFFFLLFTLPKKKPEGFEAKGVRINRESTFPEG